jgi:hypothetical protein
MTPDTSGATSGVGLQKYPHIVRLEGKVFLL